MEQKEIDIEKAAGQALLEKGIPFKIRNGRFARLLTRSEFKNYELKPLKLGTLIHVSTIACDIPELNEERSLISLALENPDLYKKILLAIAYAILNDELLIQARAKLLAQKLKWRLTASETFALWVAITSQMGVESFFFTINLIKGKNLLTPKDIKGA